ncbi:MAG: hypothetical protein ACPL1A_10060 [Candidatus Kapaibacteriota bacterium]
MKIYILFLIIFINLCNISVAQGVKYEILNRNKNIDFLNSKDSNAICNHNRFFFNCVYDSINMKLIYFKTEWKAFPGQVEQLRYEVSYDTAKTWKTIYKVPYDSEIDTIKKSLFYYPISIGYILNPGYLVFTYCLNGRYYIVSMKEINNGWSIINKLDLPVVYDVNDIISINEQEGFCILNEPGKNEYSIIKTEDSWKSYKIVYRSKFSIDYGNLNLNPDLMYLSTNRKVIKENTIVFKHKYENHLLITDKDFKNIQIVDFVNYKKIIGVRVLNDSTIYVLTSQTRKDTTAYLFFTIEKTTNKGKTWETIYDDYKIRNPYQASYEESVFNNTLTFYDENNFFFLRITSDAINYTYDSTWHIFYTKNGGKTFETIIIPRIISTNYHRKIDDNIINSPLFYKYDFFDNQGRDDIPYSLSYSSPNTILIVDENGNYYSNDEVEDYPASLKLNETYSTNCKNCSLKDIAPFHYFYFWQIKLNEKGLDFPRNLRLINYDKYLYNEDTLKWEKIEDALKYEVRIFKFSHLYPKIEKIMIDTTVEQNWIATPNLQKGYWYTFWVRSVKEKEKSLWEYLLSFWSLEPLNLLPVNLISLKKPKYGSVLEIADTLKSSTLNIEWEPVLYANNYRLYLFEIYFPPEITGEYDTYNVYHITPVVIEENYKKNSYLYKYLKPNRYYQLILWAENETSTSTIINYYYYTSDNLSVKENETKIITFPNPAYSTARVKLQQEGQVAITAVDLLGRSFPIWSGYASTGDMELDISTLPTGSYTLLIDYGTKREAMRLMKE